jgi:hypothetical protein
MERLILGSMSVCDRFTTSGNEMETPLTRRLFIGIGGIAPFATRQAHAADRVKFADLWSEGAEFSDRAKSFAGQTVEMRGYMAPPLKPEVDFYVLTSTPMATCPFCDSEATWPQDIVLVMLARPLRPQSYSHPLTVSGILDIGTQTEEKTGFVSRVRLWT